MSEFSAGDMLFTEYAPAVAPAILGDAYEIFDLIAHRYCRYDLSHDRSEVINLWYLGIDGEHSATFERPSHDYIKIRAESSWGCYSESYLFSRPVDEKRKQHLLYMATTLQEATKMLLNKHAFVTIKYKSD